MKFWNDMYIYKLILISKNNILFNFLLKKFYIFK